MIIPVRIYQYAISPFTPASCRHVPSCSEYAVQALRMHGPVKGGAIAANRIARCHPWGTEGFDPVWFTILFAVVLQSSFLTPLVGFSLFYLKGVAPEGVTTGQIYRGIIPFNIMIFLTLVILFLFEDLVLWLPQAAYGG